MKKYIPILDGAFRAVSFLEIKLDEVRLNKIELGALPHKSTKEKLKIKKIIVIIILENKKKGIDKK